MLDVAPRHGPVLQNALLKRLPLAKPGGITILRRFLATTVGFLPDASRIFRIFRRSRLCRDLSLGASSTPASVTPCHHVRPGTVALPPDGSSLD